MQNANTREEILYVRDIVVIFIFFLRRMAKRMVGSCSWQIFPFSVVFCLKLLSTNMYINIPCVYEHM